MFDHIRLDDVTIYSVSTNIEQLNFKTKGSIYGGTFIFLKAVGLDPTPSNNAVNIGPYPCIIPGILIFIKLFFNSLITNN